MNFTWTDSDVNMKSWIYVPMKPAGFCFLLRFWLVDATIGFGAYLFVGGTFMFRNSAWDILLYSPMTYLFLYYMQEESNEGAGLNQSGTAQPLSANSGNPVSAHVLI
jgi:hypothetical protein